MQIKKLFSKNNTKRGDTIIEAMFAFAVFSLVSIITVSMMNLGIAASERSLELTTVRNELNAQAEALRFIHNSFVSELSLPECGADNGSNSASASGNCQQYRKLWTAITEKARVSASVGGDDSMNIEYPLSSCNVVYEAGTSGKNLLERNNAFVINVRNLRPASYKAEVPASQSISWASTPDLFSEASLNARIIYSNGSQDSSNQLNSAQGLEEYRDIKKVEGIWVVGVKGPNSDNGQPQYYDFYVETCWYGANNSTPTSLDSVIRLYNPEAN